MKLRILCAFGAMLLLVSSAQAALNSKQRVRAFEKLPDWTGLWEADNKDATKGTENAPKGYADVALLKLASMPPYTAEWKAKVEANIKNQTAKPRTTLCAFGFPAMMDGPGIFQIMVMPEETVLLFHGDDVRHVYTDGRSHPPAEDLWPTPVGDSIGHWEGDTLVIDTIARKAGPLHLNPYYVVSEQARYIERIRLIGTDQLENRMTVEDPLTFERPLNVTLRYKRIKDLDRVLYQDCTENERNPVVDGKVTIAPAAR